jgi:hypothetical protein
LIEREINEINDLRGIDSSIPVEEINLDSKYAGIHLKIKEKANNVIEALAFEFKLFRELTSVQN